MCIRNLQRIERKFSTWFHIMKISSDLTCPSQTGSSDRWTNANLQVCRVWEKCHDFTPKSTALWVSTNLIVIFGPRRTRFVGTAKCTWCKTVGFYRWVQLTFLMSRSRRWLVGTDEVFNFTLDHRKATACMRVCTSALALKRSQPRNSRCKEKSSIWAFFCLLRTWDMATRIGVLSHKLPSVAMKSSIWVCKKKNGEHHWVCEKKEWRASSVCARKKYVEKITEHERNIARGLTYSQPYILMRQQSVGQPHNPRSCPAKRDNEYPTEPIFSQVREYQTVWAFDGV